MKVSQSRSSDSRRYHAVRRFVWRAQSAMSVVLPKPASATMSPRRPAAARSSHEFRRSRDRVSPRGGGQWTFAGWIGRGFIANPAATCRDPTSPGPTATSPCPIRPAFAVGVDPALVRWAEPLLAADDTAARVGDGAQDDASAPGARSGGAGGRWRSESLGGRHAGHGAGGRSTRAYADPRLRDRRRRAVGAPGLVLEAKLRWTWYSTICPSSIRAVDFTTSIVRMLRTVRDAVATAWRAASLHEFGLVPTISRTMITPTSLLLLLVGDQHRPALGRGTVIGVRASARHTSARTLSKHDEQ